MCDATRASGAVVWGFFPRTTLGAEGRIETKPLGHPLDPMLASKRLSTIATAPQRLQVLHAFRPVDTPGPRASLRSFGESSVLTNDDGCNNLNRGAVLDSP